MTLSSVRVKQWASEAGFSHCGIARAHQLQAAQDLFVDALANGYHAGMAFLERQVDKRFDPQLLLPDCKSVIVVTFPYLIDEQPCSDKYRTARYTWIEDYHTLVKRQLNEIVDKIKTEIPDTQCVVTVDSSCISEKNWAVEAGVGCYGRNGLIHNEQGSFFVIGVVLADKPTDFYDSPAVSDCVNCSLCVDNCPAGALSKPYQVDAEKCFAYHTIENKNPDNKTLEESPLIFGCDVCQEVCPKNKKNALRAPKITKSSLFLRLQNQEVENLSKDAFETYFGDTAIARRKYERLMLAIAAKQTDIQE